MDSYWRENFSERDRLAKLAVDTGVGIGFSSKLSCIRVLKS